jgi:phosphatidylinositol alpha-mannosyltransferase
MFPDHYHLIPNGIDLARFGPRCGVTSAVVRPPNRPLTLLFVGRLDWRKGFHHLLQSFIKLKPDYSQLRLVVVGPFAARACRTYQLQAQNQGITDIDFVGYVSPERLPEFYHQADIFCAPAVGYESFGIILLEAMAAGLPIVASDIAGYRSVISHGQEGLLVPPHRPDRIEHALRQLLDNPQDRYKMGQAGRRKAAAYSWDDIVAQTLVLYQETIDQKCLGSRSSPPFSRPKAKV